MILYRPVGPKELELIGASGRFPPRLPGQPIFYPVVQLEYAERITKEWNLPTFGVGYVTRFEVDDSFMARYEERAVGGKACTEYWIPAEELEEFNRHLTSPITVVREFKTVHQ